MQQINGLPEQQVSDNVPQLVSQENACFCKFHGIKHIHVLLYHPSSNGLVERFAIIEGSYKKE